jgi:hypothetical protein
MCRTYEKQVRLFTTSLFIDTTLQEEGHSGVVLSREGGKNEYRRKHQVRRLSKSQPLIIILKLFLQDSPVLLV